jgi:diadenylate cyclase
MGRDGGPGRNMPNFLTDLAKMTSMEYFEAFVEIAIFALVFYFILRFLHGTRGLRIMKGILGLVAVILLTLLFFQSEGEGSPAFDLPRIREMADTLLTATLLALVVVFQPEIRRGLTRLGEVEFFNKPDPSLSPIAQAAVRLARKRIGAIIVIEGTVGLATYTEGAEKINAEVNVSLLQSIFYPNSPLHDGAVLVRGSRIVAAGCLLPLSEQTQISSELGTRHRAALGITEESDAVVVVVSEETGRMRVAYRGRLREAKDGTELEDMLTETIRTSAMEESPL